MALPGTGSKSSLPSTTLREAWQGGRRERRAWSREIRNSSVWGAHSCSCSHTSAKRNSSRSRRCQRDGGRASPAHPGPPSHSPSSSIVWSHTEFLLWQAVGKEAGVSSLGVTESREHLCLPWEQTGPPELLLFMHRGVTELDWATGAGSTGRPQQEESPAVTAHIHGKLHISLENCTPPWKTAPQAAPEPRDLSDDGSTFLLSALERYQGSWPHPEETFWTERSTSCRSGVL